MKTKLTTLEDAARHIQDGHHIVMSGRMTGSPMALLRQVARLRRRNLRLIGVVGAAINVDFLVGAGAVDTVDTCSVSLAPFARTGPNFSRAVTQGLLKPMDNT
jgi:glutaconate CoA-transferase, subunit A